jgi:hypothetical protein
MNGQYGQPASGGIPVTQVLGGVMAAGCGLALYWLLGPLQEALQPLVGQTGATAAAIAVLVLTGGVSAFLMRSLWALLIVPTCFLVSWYTGGVIDALLPGRLYKPWEPAGLLEMLGLFVIYLLPPLLVGTAIGAATRTWLEARLLDRRHPLQRTAPLTPLALPPYEREREPLMPR